MKQLERQAEYFHVGLSCTVLWASTTPIHLTVTCESHSNDMQSSSLKHEDILGAKLVGV
jgi:hypothetical protein